MKILLIEHIRPTRGLSRRCSSQGRKGPLSLATVPELQLGLAALREQTCDVLLLDLGLPDSQGLETLAKVLEATADWLPVVVLTGVDDEVLAVDAVRQGAQDFLVKTGLTAELLTCTLRYTVEGHRAQRALLETEERFREMAENIECVFWMRSAEEHRMLYVSPAYERVWGRSIASLYQQPGSFIDAVHPADRERVLAKVLQERLARPEELDIEYRIVRPDGSIRWIRDRGFPIRSAPGKPARIAGIAEDITSRNAVEEARRRLATAIEQADEAFLITDAQGTIVYANPVFEKITGYSPKEALGQNPRILKSGKQDAAFYKRMWAGLVQGQVWRGRFVNKRKDGVLYEEDESITPLRDLTGQITNYVAVKRDVSREVFAGGPIAPGAEDGCHRPARRRRGARLQQPAGHHQRQRRTAAVAWTLRLGADAVECLKHIIAAAERAANLTRQLLAFSRKQVMQSQPAGSERA